MDLQKGLQTHDSFLRWSYIYLTAGRGWAGERSKTVPCLLALNVISQMPSLPWAGLLAVVPLMPLLFGGAWGGLLNLIDFSTLISKWRWNTCPGYLIGPQNQLEYGDRLEKL